MKTIVKFALGCLAVLAVAGCTASWQHMHEALREDAIASGITVGKTTKAELDTSLGSAKALSFDTGYEVWVYHTREEAAGLARYLPAIGKTALFIPERKWEVVVLFHPDGVVKKYRIHRYRG
ncbi:hypothetical protein [Janthinobacterium sp.]|uniref:hypothetical protein n=1 Tax=Janthinobacterium sp. TaxID=1871054 RepID=UPI00293D30F1|nr:hypothetical protein [Janthinobacterium sp.]